MAQGERGREGGRGNKKTPSQLIDEGFESESAHKNAEYNAARTSAVRAEAAGTNRQYIDMAAGLALAGETGIRWTRLSLAQICGGVIDRAKRKAENRGTGLAKSTAVLAIKEAVKLGVLKKRTHRSPGYGIFPTSYAIDWKRVTELAEESKRWSNVKSYRRSQSKRPAGGKAKPE